MEQRKDVLAQRRRLSHEANERWKGSQPGVSARKGAGARRNEAVPRPRVGEITSEQRQLFEQRQRLRNVFDSTAYRALRIAAERQIGATLDYVDLPPNDQAHKAGRPVARIVTLPGPGIVPQGFATGFLVAPDLILTNHHVFRAIDEARGVGAQFLYERVQAGLNEGVIFEFDPDRFFLNNSRLDYALVAVRTQSLTGSSLGQFQYLPLIEVRGKVRKGDPVHIIQHPNGEPKRYATENNRLLDLRDDGFLLYETDTLEGSSGAPVFSEHWETIGLHHCGVPQMEDGQLVLRDGRRVPVESEVADSDLVWVANEGVRVSAIIESLRRQRPPKPEQQQILEAFLALTVDPLRMVEDGRPPSGDILLPPFNNDPRATMGQNLFHFSGPVTINLLSPAPNAIVAEAPRVLPPGDADVAGDFREKTLKFDEHYERRDQHGYQPDFLDGWAVPAPTVNGDHPGALLESDGGPWAIPYYHFSLAMNVPRRLLAWAASNVDYSADARAHTKTRKEYGGENWRLDPRVAVAAPGLQIIDANFYAPAKKIDRGHIVRREDGAWGGTAKEAEYGNSDTYHWTNCTPQSEAFNQSGKSGIWGQFEDHIQSEVRAIDGRMSVFAGPVLNPADPEHGYEGQDKIRVPMEFWKVVVCVSRENGERKNYAYGFVFDQTEPVQRLGFERMNMEDYEVYQMPIAEITKKTGVVFDASILAADVLKGGGADESIRGFKGKKIRALEGIVLR